MVVMFFPEACETGVEQDRIAAPSACTVQAPHKPAPHPNFVPVSSSVSRRTQSRGVSGETLTFFSLPFTRRVTSAMLVQSRWCSLLFQACFAAWTTIVLNLRKNGNGTKIGKGASMTAGQNGQRDRSSRSRGILQRGGLEVIPSAIRPS